MFCRFVFFNIKGISELNLTVSSRENDNNILSKAD